MSNLESLVNDFLKIKCIIEDNEAKLKELRQAILDTGMDYIEGTYGAVQVQLSERSNFDNALAKAFLTQDQIAVCTKKPTLIHTVKAVAKQQPTA